MNILKWILKHLCPVENDKWTLEHEIEYAVMGTDGKLKVIKLYGKNNNHP